MLVNTIQNSIIQTGPCDQCVLITPTIDTITLKPFLSCYAVHLQKIKNKILFHHSMHFDPLLHA